MIARNSVRKFTRHLRNLGFIRSISVLKTLITWTQPDQEFLDFHIQFFQPGDLIFDVRVLENLVNLIQILFLPVR